VVISAATKHYAREETLPQLAKIPRTDATASSVGPCSHRPQGWDDQTNQRDKHPGWTAPDGGFDGPLTTARDLPRRAEKQSSITSRPAGRRSWLANRGRRFDLKARGTTYDKHLE